MNSFKKWMKAATSKEVSKLARLSKTSKGYLQHILKGRREPSAMTAINIEAAVRLINKDLTGRPVVLQGDINKACAKCPYYKACKQK